MRRPREIAVYEKLAPNDCLIMYKTRTEFLVATNKKGEIKLKWVKYRK